MRSSRRALLRVLASATATVALLASGLVLGAPASAASLSESSHHASHHSSSTPRISFAFFQNGVRSGDEQVIQTTVGLVIRTSRASSTDQSVRVRTFGGTAAAGQYEATDRRISIPAGKTSVGFRIPVDGIGEGEARTHFYVGLSSPSSGARLGLLRVARVTIYPWLGPPPLGGYTARSQDFESGVPDAIETFASRPAVRPALRTVYSSGPTDLPENRALQLTVSRAPRATDSFGFREVTASVDLEPSAVGPTIWFKGTASGGTVAIVLGNGNRVFEYPVVDDGTGWRHLEPAFSDFRLRGDPGSAARFDPDDYTGYEIRLSGVTPGRYLFDSPSVVYIF